ncbi:MAG: hypothetical protein MJY66_08780 [Bacteroidaceae bacterium]|nr:hypothetical protein [Bacteroidaceae bacterium]
MAGKTPEMAKIVANNAEKSSHMPSVCSIGKAFTFFRQNACKTDILYIILAEEKRHTVSDLPEIFMINALYTNEKSKASLFHFP